MPNVLCEKIILNLKSFEVQPWTPLKVILRGVEWVHGLFLFPLVLGKM